MFDKISPRPFLNTYRRGCFLPYQRQNAINIFGQEYCEFEIEKKYQQLGDKHKFDKSMVS
jgi:hypothetical protein